MDEPDIGTRLRHLESQAIQILQTKYGYTSEDIEESRAFPRWNRGPIQYRVRGEIVCREEFLRAVRCQDGSEPQMELEPLSQEEAFLRGFLSRTQALRDFAQAGDITSAITLSFGIGEFVNEYRLRNPEDPWGKQLAIGRELEQSGSEGGKERARRMQEEIQQRDAELMGKILTYLQQKPDARNSEITQALLSQSEDKERAYRLKKGSLQKKIGELRKKLEL